MSETGLQPGTLVGRYEICHLVGAGGMGVVYAARDAALERRVALKILSPDLTTDSLRVQRFVNEAKSASTLNHPAIVTVYEFGEAMVDDLEHPVHYIAMELVDGMTLADWRVDEEPPLSELIRRIATVAHAVGKAHSRGVVHRDLKPDNIMVTTEGQAKLLDFGLAKLVEPLVSSAQEAPRPTLTRPSAVLGTIGYMAPEQVEGQLVDHRADIFALGCILHEGVSGSLPFSGETNAEVLYGIVHETPPPVELSNVELTVMANRILNRALAKDRERRYDSAVDMSHDLEELASAIERSTTLEVVKNWLGRGRSLPRVVVSSVLAILLIGLPAMAVVDSVRNQDLERVRGQLADLQLIVEEKERRITLQDLEIQRLTAEQERQEELRADLEGSYRGFLDDVATQVRGNEEERNQLRLRLRKAEDELEVFREAQDQQARLGNLRNVEKELPGALDARVEGDRLIATIPGFIFETGETRIGFESRSLIRAVADQLRAHPELKVRVEGHADSNGDAQENLELSRQRAEVIARILAVDGVEPERITTLGHGEMVPLHSNDTQRGRVLNRRVNLVLGY